MDIVIEGIVGVSLNKMVSPNFMMNLSGKSHSAGKYKGLSAVNPRGDNSYMDLSLCIRPKS